MDQSPPFPIVTDDFPQEAQDLIDGRIRQLKMPNQINDDSNHNNNNLYIH